MTNPPELLAPAGGWDCLRAAVANGADAVYFGLPRFNARLRADNFTEAELPEVVECCHRHGVKAYVAFNTLVFTGELEAAAEYLRLLNRAGVDALIVQDIGLVRLAAEITPELPIHASTQMTITSPEGAEFARALGIGRAVLARELSIRDLQKFGASAMPLEVFVHGALCVAYSGQCLTSEALGQRSANRGECAQACRMPYQLIVDGAVRDLGDRAYLLSPQDLAAVNEIPALIEAGVVSFKIEGRLKSPEYVAAVCQVYRKAIDAALAVRAVAGSSDPVGRARAGVSAPGYSAADRYQLEMTFSRGLYSGWMHGVNHQELVAGRFGKKRGPLAGRIEKVGRDFVEFAAAVPLRAGDGVVFDTGGDTNAEQGGRIFEVRGQRYFFQHGHLDFGRLQAGDRVWKTSDPELEKRLRKSFTGRIAMRHRAVVNLAVSGRAGETLVVLGGTGGPTVASGGPPEAVRMRIPAGSLRENAEAGRLSTRASGPCHPCRAASAIPLQAARTAPLTAEKLREHLGRFGDSGYVLGELVNALEGEVILPIGELNRLRRELVFQLDASRAVVRQEGARTVREILAEGTAFAPNSEPPASARGAGEQVQEDGDGRPSLRVLCRSMEQLDAALRAGIAEVYVDFEDIRRYRDAVAVVRASGSGTQIFLATPRIQKPGEHGFFRLMENAAPDGVLIRNLGAIAHFHEHTALRKVGDFSLNVANPLSAQYFISQGLERVTISYDLNLAQVLDLLAASRSEWLEITLHQHMPMFHMEHCVFAAFMSKGTTFLDCGRPCEKHRVRLRDRVGMEHPLRADVGCRNTLFNAVAQTGAGYFAQLEGAGLRDFRIELLEENAEEAAQTIRAYQGLIAGQREGRELWRELRAQAQLGVTRGTLG